MPGKFFVEDLVQAREVVFFMSGIFRNLVRMESAHCFLVTKYKREMERSAERLVRINK